MSNQKDKEETGVKECVVCWLAPRTHVFVPCGHLCVCKSCSSRLMESRKICPTCENKSKPNRSNIKEESITQKWNCGIFLEFDTLAFGKCKPSDSFIKITSEPKFSNFITKKDRTWNCDSNVRFINLNYLKSGISKLKKYRNLQFRNSNNLLKGLNASLIYE